MTPGEAAFMNASRGMRRWRAPPASSATSASSGSQRLGGDRARRSAAGGTWRWRRSRASFFSSRGNSTRSWPGSRGVSPSKPVKRSRDVGGVADLAHLAVADDVDAGVDSAAARPPRRRRRSTCARRFGVRDRSPCSRANSTSVTACERGRLPTCVVRMRSVLLCASSRYVLLEVWSPASQRLSSACALPARRVDLLDVRMIERELHDHAVRDP